MTPALLPVVAFWLAASPASAHATLKTSAGDVKIGHAGALAPAKAGETIAPDDVIALGVGAHATVVLADGHEKILEGRCVLTGRRLAGESAADKVLLSDAVRKEAFARLDLEANESTETAQRGSNVSELGLHHHKLTFMGEEEEEEHRMTSDADFAESRLRLGDETGAIDYAWSAIADPDSAPLDCARAHLVLGRIAVDRGDVDAALHEFDRAAGDFFVATPKAVEVRAEALVQRGQTRMSVGDDAGATSDFDAVVALDATSAPAAQANFFLGVLAISHSDLDGARDRFSRIGKYPELARAGSELLAEAGR